MRDLAAALLSPPLLINAPVRLRHPLAGSVWFSQPNTLTDWLEAQNSDPHDLIAWLNLQPTQRLGRYYEKLWGYALQHAPDIHVIAQNLVIQGAQQTLGELDMLYEDAQGVHHLELAAKFYLAPAKAHSHAQDWRGPDSRDSLADKLNRLANHQLRLTEQPLVQEHLRALGIGRIQSSAWLGGMLFTQQCFTHLARWQYHGVLDEGIWVEVPKLGWLTPVITDKPCSFTQDASRIQMLARLAPYQGRYVECERRLLMPYNWPNRR